MRSELTDIEIDQIFTCVGVYTYDMLIRTGFDDIAAYTMINVAFLHDTKLVRKNTLSALTKDTLKVELEQHIDLRRLGGEIRFELERMIMLYIETNSIKAARCQMRMNMRSLKRKIICWLIEDVSTWIKLKCCTKSFNPTHMQGSINDADLDANLDDGFTGEMEWLLKLAVARHYHLKG